MNAKQKENESLHDYTRRFKTCRDIIESQLGGPIELKKYIQTLPEYIEYNERTMEQENKTQSDSDSEQESKENKYEMQQNLDIMKRNLIKKASEKLYAFIYLENSNQNKFAGVIKTLNQQKSFGNYQFPNTIVEASEILSNHNYENNKIKNAQRNANKINAEINKTIEKGENQNVNQAPIPTLSFAQLKIRCYCCGKKGHKSPQCKYKNTIPNEDWAITKTKRQFTQSNNSIDNDVSTMTTKESTISKKQNEKKIGWANLHFTFFQSKEMKELVLLDSDSTDTVFCNKNYVTNVRKSDKPLILKTNGGEIVTTEICDVPYLGTQWFNENAVTNIISLADIAEKYRVTMDTKDEKSFTVYLPDKTIKFPQMRGGLYARNPQESKQSFQLTSILKNKKQENFVTKEKNKKSFSCEKITKSNGISIPRRPKKGCEPKSNKEF